MINEPFNLPSLVFQILFTIILFRQGRDLASAIFLSRPLILLIIKAEYHRTIIVLDFFFEAIVSVNLGNLHRCIC